MKPLSTKDIMRYIRRNATLPDDTEETFNEEDMLDMINEELSINIVKTLQDVNQEYDVVDIDVAVPTAEENYAIKVPSRASANKLRAIKYVDSSENLEDLHRVTLDNLSDYNNSCNTADVFHVQGDEIRFPGGLTNTSGTLRLFYHLTQSTLVPNDEVGVIASISAPYDMTILSETVSVIDIVVSEIPDDFDTVPLFDFVMTKSPNKPLAIDVECIAVNKITGTVTFRASSVPARLRVGDILATAEETIYPSIPPEMHPLVAMAVAVRVAESQTDEVGLKLLLNRYEQMKNNILKLIDNRVEGSPLKFKMKYNTLNSAIGRTR